MRSYATEGALSLLETSQRITEIKADKDNFPYSDKLEEIYKKISAYSFETMTKEIDILPMDFIILCSSLLIEAKSISMEAMRKKRWNPCSQAKKAIGDRNFSRILMGVEENIEKGKLFEASDQIIDLIDVFRSSGILET